MKNSILLFGAILLINAAAHATIRTVSNNVSSPGQYYNLQTAINACSAGDTLYVEPSLYDYGNITINIKLYIFAGGFDGRTYQFNLHSTVDNITFNTTGFPNYYTPAGTVIEGLYVNSGITTNADTVNNITIERCQLEGTISTSYDGNSPNHYGWLFVNNIIDGGYYGMQINNGYNMAFMNNFFTSGNFSVTNSNQTSVVFANNIFTNGCLGCGQLFFNTVSYAIFNNNIFYYRGDVQSPPTVFTGCVSCTFDDNITYSSAAQTLPDAGNTGSGNINNTNPLFVTTTIPTTASITDGTINNYNWSLQTASPGHNAGTDATDIGYDGGAYPLTIIDGVTRLPQVKYMNIQNSSLPLNGTLNVHVIGLTHN